MDTKSSTYNLFESLRNLYSQASDLLLDADRIMGERGWQAVNSNGPGEYSYSINSPAKWFARWAARFYYPSASDDETPTDSLLFVSVHFASDEDTVVDEPLLALGYLLFAPALERLELLQQWKNSYWICKSWYYGEVEEDCALWRTWRVPSNLIAPEPVAWSFSMPLYSIDSPEPLRKAIETLLKEFDD